MAEGIDIVGSDTENHLMTVDLRKLDKTGKDISNELEEVGITANKNTVPNDPKSPFITSGVRIGVPAATTRGFKENEMIEIGKIIADTIKGTDTKENLRKELLSFVKNFLCIQIFHAKMHIGFIVLAP